MILLVQKLLSKSEIFDELNLSAQQNHGGLSEGVIVKDLNFFS